MDELIEKMTQLEYQGDGTLPNIGGVRHTLERVKYGTEAVEDAIADIERHIEVVEELIAAEDTYTKREGRALIVNALAHLRTL